MKEFDEQDAVKCMREALCRCSVDTTAISDDDLYNVLDLIWDYYETNGLLEIDGADDEDDVIEVDDIADYARRMLRRDADFGISDGLLPVVIAAELDYEASLDDIV